MSINLIFWSNPQWVTPDIICQEFNQRQFYEKAQRGELVQHVFHYNTHLKRSQRKELGEPHCTRSQMVIYYDSNGEPVALVHQYKRRDGSLGGSGKPDPKRLFVSGQVIAVRQSP